MDHPEGAGSLRADRVDFDRRVRVEFRGAQISSDGGLLVMRELDDTLGLSDLASAALLPVALFPDLLKQVVVLAAMRLEIEAEIKDRLLQDAVRAEQEGNQEPAQTAVSIEKRVYYLKLDVN